MPDEPRRAHERHTLVDPAAGEVKIYHPMGIRQMSAGGALIEIAVPLQLDSLHDFRLALGDRSVVVKARVVHSHIDTVASSGVRYHTGIEFVDLSDAVSAVIGAFLASDLPPAPR